MRVYRHRPVNVYVEVVARIDKKGRIHPLSIIWDDGRTFKIERIINQTESMTPQGDKAYCFDVMVSGQRRELYVKDGIWFVIIDQDDY